MEATQSLAIEEIEPTQRAFTGFSAEFAAYAVLLLVSLVLRVAQLDVVPMTNPEAREALAAWRVVYPQASGSLISSQSPVLFLLHSLSFSTLGASEFSARIWTALGSLVLILTPLLFRAVFGRGRTFVFSVLLAFSPVILVASRTDSAVVWTVLCGVIALWALWRYYESAAGQYAVLALVLFGSMILLTDPTGFVFTLILIGAGLFALWLTPRNLDVELDETAPDPLFTFRERLRNWPWMNSLLVTGLTIILVSTLFLLNTARLSGVGELLGAGLRGITMPRAATPPFFPILVTLFYEPVLVISGMVAILLLLRRDTFTFFERFLVAWLGLGIVASLIYAGTGAEQALWLVLPLAGLASSLVVTLLTRTEHPSWWDVPRWSKWVIVLCSIFLLGMFSIHLQALGRALISLPEGAVQLNTLNSASIVLVIISAMSMVIGFFLASSLWGLETTAQGAALGLLAFGLVTSLTSGWRAAVVTAENPVEFWNREAVSGDTWLLRDTLIEVARRESGGYPRIPIVALAPEDGMVAWLLRDYVNTRFITHVNDAQNQEIVLLPLYNEPPDLGSSYVGQTFLMSKTWDPSTVQLSDWLSWWIARRTRTPGTPSNTMVLWLRQDIYNGVAGSNTGD